MKDTSINGRRQFFISGSGSRRAKIAHKIRKREEISCFEVLDVLF
jgi:hypothetical protein